MAEFIIYRDEIAGMAAAIREAWGQDDEMAASYSQRDYEAAVLRWLEQCKRDWLAYPDEVADEVYDLLRNLCEVCDGEAQPGDTLCATHRMMEDAA